MAQNPMVGRRVFLRPVLPDDGYFLNQLATHPRTGAFWRWQGLPRTADPIGGTWPNVLVAFIVTARRTGEPAALAVANNPDMLSQTCAISYAVSPELYRSGWHLEGAALFVNYLFQAWEMRKIYFEVLQYNLGEFEQISRMPGIAQEGRLRDHVLMGGTYQDVVHYAIYRDTWLAGAEQRLHRMTGSSPLSFLPGNSGESTELQS